MRIEANKVKGQLRDLDTGEIVQGLVWFDLEAGTFEARQYDKEGMPKRCKEGFLTLKYRGRIRFEGKRGKHTIPLLDDQHKCQSCTRKATYAVSDETPLPAAVQDQKQFLQGRMVATRYYCEWCYQGPRILDAKGEVMETIEDGHGVRPQWHS
jgi:hypothetical protein